MKILVGADPEIFMYQDGKPVSAHGVIKGTKEHPSPVKNGAVQVDGMALEFNIDPASSEEEFANNIESVMGVLKGMLPGYDLKPTPVAEFGLDYIHNQPLESLVLGCDPDFNAWNGGKVNPRPNADNPFRTGAGHVHIGWTKDANPYDPGHREAGIMLTKQLDFYLGLPSLFYDKSSKRRTMYGAPGAFRPKSYGVEYRVLSNAWLANKELMKWVFNNTVLAVNRLMEGRTAYQMRGAKAAVNLLCEDNPDLSTVSKIMNKFSIPMPPQVA